MGLRKKLKGDRIQQLKGSNRKSSIKYQSINESKILRTKNGIVPFACILLTLVWAFSTGTGLKPRFLVEQVLGLSISMCFNQNLIIIGEGKLI